jgi:hypothetical protein
LRQSRPKGDKRPRHAFDDPGEQQRDPEQSEQRHRRDAAVLIGLDDPAAGNRRQGCNDGEGQRHPGKHRQTAARERPIRPGEDERQDRENARADDRQNAAEIRQEEQDHWLCASLGTTPSFFRRT